MNNKFLVFLFYTVLGTSDLWASQRGHIKHVSKDSVDFINDVAGLSLIIEDIPSATEIITPKSKYVRAKAAAVGQLRPDNVLDGSHNKLYKNNESIDCLSDLEISSAGSISRSSSRAGAVSPTLSFSPIDISKLQKKSVSPISFSSSPTPRQSMSPFVQEIMEDIKHGDYKTAELLINRTSAL